MTAPHRPTAGRPATTPPEGRAPTIARALGRVLGAVLAVGSPAAAQAPAGVDPTAPRPVVHAQGHGGEVRDLAFVEDGANGLLLLSAGQDKVVHVWNLADGRPRLSRTLRPPISRGPAGSINAIALSPPDEAGRRLLAVGGYGVMAGRGEITLFHFPGRPGVDRGTGDVAAVLREGYLNRELFPRGPEGHSNVVNALEFHPTDPRLLASAGHDGTVRLWDLADLDRPATRAVLRGDLPLADAAPLLAPTGEPGVNELAFSPDGARLIAASGGSERDGVLAGTVRTWDVGDPAAPRLVQRLGNPALAGRPGAWTNPKCLAVSPDGRWAFVGQEDGQLLRYALTDRGLADPDSLTLGDGRGPVEALACAATPAGLRLASSIIEDGFPSPSGLPPIDCVVELWEADAPRPGRSPIGRSRGKTIAVAFTPDGRHVAHAGGSNQAIALVPVVGDGDGDGADPGLVLSGNGGTIWDVRFRDDGSAIGFSRHRPGDPDAPGGFEGFRIGDDFGEQLDRLIPVDPGGLSGPIGVSSDGRWAIHPYDSLALFITDRRYDPAEPDPTLVRCVVRLDRVIDGRWWCFSFIPPSEAEGHPGEVVAVGCEMGVRVFGLVDDPEGPCPRLRAFEGHNGAVYALAPSPDGRWLATGSTDQTIRLWRLDGCDRRAPLGAGLRSLAPDRGGLLWEVVSVAEEGFGARAGLRAGDVVTGAFAGGSGLLDVNLVSRVDPGTRIDLRVSRDGVELLLGTSRRDEPALSIFPGRDGEWIAWTPPGYYQASIAGASTYLIWHRNLSATGGPTDVAPFDAYEGRFHRPAVLDELIRTGDLVAALAKATPEAEAEPGRPGPVAIAEAVADEPPPRLPTVRVTPRIPGIDEPSPDRVLVSDEPVLRLDVQVGAAGEPIRAVEVFADAFRVVPPVPIAGDARRLDLVDDRAVVVPLAPGLQKISVVVEDRQGNRAPRGPTYTVAYLPPEPPEPRAWVVSLGVEEFLASSDLPAIPFAARDAGRVAAFLAERTARDGFDRVAADVAVLAGAAGTADAAGGALDRIGARRDARGPSRGDAVFVFVNSHFVDLAGGLGAGLLGVDADPEAGSGLIPSADLAESLGRLVDYGCRVVLLLDAVHPEAPEAARPRALADWVRRDLLGRGVIVVLASNAGPSGVVGAAADAGGLGAFARGLVTLYDDPDAIPVRLRGRAGLAVRTVDDVRHGLGLTVPAQSRNKRQRVGFFVPRSIAPNTPFFGPPSGAGVAVASREAG